MARKQRLSKTTPPLPSFGPVLLNRGWMKGTGAFSYNLATPRGELAPDGHIGQPCRTPTKGKRKGKLRPCHVELLLLGASGARALRENVYIDPDTGKKKRRRGAPQPAAVPGMYLRVCKKKGVPGRLVRVTTLEESRDIAKTFCACRKGGRSVGGCAEALQERTTGVFAGLRELFGLEAGELEAARHVPPRRKLKIPLGKHRRFGARPPMARPAPVLERESRAVRWGAPLVFWGSVAGVVLAVRRARAREKP